MVKYKEHNGLEEGWRVRTIQVRLLYTMLIVAMAVSLINLVVNFVGGFHWTLSIKWILLFTACFITLLTVLQKGYKELPIYLIFLFIILIFLPYGYIESGGAANNTIGYLFLVMISFSYLFRGWKRGVLVVLMILMFTGLHILEFVRPEIFPTHDPATQFLDRLIQIPILLVVSFLIIRRFAIDYERIHDNLDKAANSDELTGLYNRRFFNKHIEQVLMNEPEDYQLALMDLDQFKKLNDRHGHQKGDEFLIHFSDLLRRYFPERKQVISRWGGDEFAVLFNGDKDELIRRLADVKRDFSKSVEKIEPGVGVSFGYVPMTEAEDVEMLLNKADYLLYKAKNGEAKVQHK